MKLGEIQAYKKPIRLFRTKLRRENLNEVEVKLYRNVCDLLWVNFNTSNFVSI